MRLARTLLGIVIIASLLSVARPATPVLAAVGVISINPSSGTPATQVSVTGTGFTAGSTYTISFGTTNVRTGSVDASGNLVTALFTVPSLPRGDYAVTVTTSAGDTSNAATFNITPVITLDIASGRVGDTIRVSGSGFAASASISLNFDAVSSVTVATDGTGAFFGALLTVPTVSPGRHTIRANDGFAFAPEVVFTVVARLTFSPNVQTVGSQITMFGTGFTANSPITFYIDDINVTVTPTTADISGNFSNVPLTVPPLSQGTHVLKAQDIQGVSATANLFIRPNLAVNPPSGPPGTSVQVSGSGFAANTAVTMTYNAVTIATTPSPLSTNASGSFTASLTVPPGAAGAYTVQANDGTNSASATFSVAAGAILSPASGPVGTTITINGTNFGARATVSLTYDNVQVATASADASGAFTATFKAPSSRSGTHTVIASDSTNTAIQTFTITPSASLSPASGQVDGNITVNGTGFASNAAIPIRYDNIQVTTATADAAGSFTATFKAPASQTGSHQVSAGEVTLAFTIVPGASLSPASGQVDSTITVKGTGFASGRAAAIRYDNVQVALAPPDATGSFTATFRAPNSQTGNHQVVVTDTVNTITLGFAIAPAMSLNPKSGHVGGNVAVSGVGFGAGKTITIRYDNAPVGQSTADASGTFSAAFNAPVSQGGNHVVAVTDGVSTLTADFTMDATAPATPVPLQPANGTKADALATFSWSPVTDPSGVTYTLQIATDNASFASIVLEKKGLLSPGYTLTATEKLKSVSKNKPYFWRVKAIDNALNESQWSPGRSFYVGFTLPAWGQYVIMGVAALAILVLGFWLGRRSSYYLD